MRMVVVWLMMMRVAMVVGARRRARLERHRRRGGPHEAAPLAAAALAAVARLRYGKITRFAEGTLTAAKVATAAATISHRSAARRCNGRVTTPEQVLSGAGTGRAARVAPGAGRIVQLVLGRLLVVRGGT